MVKIIEQTVSGLPVIPWAKGQPTVIVAHETANDTSTVQNEISYMSRNYKHAFYHCIAGEDGFYIMHDPSIGGAWGSGPSMHKYAIHVELIRSKTKEGFDKAYSNYVDGIKYLADKFKIPVRVNVGNDKTGIYTHHYVTKTFGGTTHTDPDGYFKKYGKTIAEFASDLGSSQATVETPTISTSGVSTTGLETLAREVLNGKHGSGKTRKKTLGARYDQVQARVNDILRGGSSNKPAKGIETLAREVLNGKHGRGEARKKALGSRYDQVQARVNQLSGVSKRTSKSTATLVSEVNRGIHGNGAERKKSLGSDYSRVQAAINNKK